MRRGLALLAVCVAPVLGAACGASSENVQENQVGSTEAAVAATPTGVANCGNYPLARRMSQYVNLVELEALPQYVANPIDTVCKLAVATLIESVPDCATGTPATARRPTTSRRSPAADRVRRPARPGVCLIRDDARELAARKAC